MKTTEPIACGKAEDTKDASQVLSPSIGQSRREQLPALPMKAEQRRASVMVPVLSSTGKPLMPCHPARARELIKKKGAKRRWFKGLYVIQLVHTNGRITQDIVCGVDPGFIREAFTLQSKHHTYLNVLSDAVIWVQSHMSLRSGMRKARRRRKTPCRKCRYNRMNNKSWIAPSVWSRWQAKLRIIGFFRKLYPINSYIIEDIRAKNKKNCKKWNKIFVPLEMGKHRFYKEVSNMGNFVLKRGFDTFERRNVLGLKKSKDKTQETFSAHNVDSWVLASFITGKSFVDNTLMFRMVPLKFHRRQLHHGPLKGGKRKLYGGTLSQGLKRGSVVNNSQLGIVYIGGGISNEAIALHNIVTGELLTARGKVKDCRFLYYNSWRSGFIDENGVPIGKRHKGNFLDLKAIYSNPEFREKINQTRLELYGDKNFTNREQAKQTCIDRYGVDNVAKVRSVSERKKRTLMERYGQIFNYFPEPLLTKDELVEFNKTMTLKEIGLKYGVSGEAVSYWAKKYNVNIIKKIVVPKHKEFEHPLIIIKTYLEECFKQNKVLTFGEYGKLTEDKKKQRLKRLFNSGHVYSHLKDELAMIALNPALWDDFFKKINIV